MATITVGPDDQVRVTFPTSEKVLGLVRDVRVPRSAVRSAHPVRSWREVRGWRVGLGLPTIRLVGTWRRRGGKQLVSLRRGVPAVRLELDGMGYDEILVSTPDASRVLEQLRS